MAHDPLQHFLSSNQSIQQDYRDFLHRFQQDPGSISEAEASQRYRELLRNASPDDVADAYQHVLAQLAPEQRQQLAQQYQNAHHDPRSLFNGFRFSDASQAADARYLGQMAQQAEQQDPDLFDKIFGPNSPLNGPLGRLALAAIAAYLANRALSQQSGPPGTNQKPSLPGGLIGALGGLIGALSNGQQSGQNPGLPSGLSDLLDALKNQQRPADSSAGTTDQAPDTSGQIPGLHVKGSQSKKQI
jgi:hypothetical protein